jgi:hypothetical protein
MIQHTVHVFSLLSLLWKKIKVAYAITMLSVCFCLCIPPFQLWIGLYETWYFYHGKWAHLNGVLRLQNMLPLGCLQSVTSHVYSPYNPGKGPLPGATQRTSETWSSHKPVSPLSVFGLSKICTLKREKLFKAQKYNKFKEMLYLVLVECTCSFKDISRAY